MKIFLPLLLFCVSCTPNTVSQSEVVVQLGQEVRDVTYNTNGKVREINWTDDKTGEDIDIFCEGNQYESWGGDIAVYCAVKNNAIEQDIDVQLFYGKGFTRSIERFEGNTETVEEVKSATSTQQITRVRSNYTELTLKDSPTIAREINRKPVAGKTDKVFTDHFTAGEEKLYRIVMRAPLTGTLNKWYVEAFGSLGAYGHLDPNNWTYEQDFEGLSAGSSLVGQDSYVNNDAEGTRNVVTTGTPNTGSQHVTQFGSSSGSGGVGRTITDIVSGTFCISMKGNQTTNGYMLMNLRDGGSGGTQALQFGLSSGNIVAYRSGGLDTVQSFTANTYYEMCIVFETGTGAWEGLSADTYTIEIDDGGPSTAKSFQNATGGLDYFRIYHFSPSGDATQTWWFDDITAPVVEAAERRRIINW